ncbi:MAG: aminoacyl-tRNA hydrolase [Chitinophagales bacterium]|nr:aminoacyl-tRNA hydrolase [Chitinophagales bacterium]MCZ2393294.1 aminoacyl-tRNA hydrolase [Chitinophagales bacterium]
MKFLIVGLGNIGKEYENTRHNIGFDILIQWAIEAGFKFEIKKYAALANISYKGKQLYFIMPTTYMNLSGKAVKYWMNELKIPIENIIVIVDDLALDFGTLRLRGKGSNAGHNGLKNIDEELQSNQYTRLRFGIGNDFPKGRQVDFVLGKWPKIQMEQLPERISTAIEICQSFCTTGLANTMSTFNNK